MLRTVVEPVAGAYLARMIGIAADQSLWTQVRLFPSLIGLAKSTNRIRLDCKLGRISYFLAKQ